MRAVMLMFDSLNRHMVPPFVDDVPFVAISTRMSRASTALKSVA